MYLCERMQIESYKTDCSPAETLISSSLQDRDLTQHLYCCSVTLLMSRHSHDKYAMCQRTPPVGETGVSRDTCVEFPGLCCSNIAQ